MSAFTRESLTDSTLLLHTLAPKYVAQGTLGIRFSSRIMIDEVKQALEERKMDFTIKKRVRGGPNHTPGKIYTVCPVCKKRDSRSGYSLSFSPTKLTKSNRWLDTVSYECWKSDCDKKEILSRLGLWREEANLSSTNTVQIGELVLALQSREKKIVRIVERRFYRSQCPSCNDDSCSLWLYSGSLIPPHDKVASDHFVRGTLYTHIQCFNGCDVVDVLKTLDLLRPMFGTAASEVRCLKYNAFYRALKSRAVSVKKIENGYYKAECPCCADSEDTLFFQKHYSYDTKDFRALVQCLNGCDLDGILKTLCIDG